MLFRSPRRRAAPSGADWEENLIGVNAGGWGLRIKTEDMAKFAQHRRPAQGGAAIAVARAGFGRGDECDFHWR